MSTYTVRYEQVGHKNLPCPGCGKKIRRQRTFTGTISPYNKDPETGLPRTRQQIHEHLHKVAGAWQAKPEMHTDCERAAIAARTTPTPSTSP